MLKLLVDYCDPPNFLKLKRGKKVDLISVVIVSYHSEDTIEDVLNSVYEQTYPNVELILADDCSQDQTLAIAKKW